LYACWSIGGTADLRNGERRGKESSAESGSRPFPIEQAIGWSAEARGVVSGVAGEDIDWRVGRTGSRLMSQKRVLFGYEPRESLRGEREVEGE